VELWQRFLARTIPNDVLDKINQNEETINTFFQHVEQKLEALQIELKDERFWNFRIAGFSVQHRTKLKARKDLI
jgi:hypothetical protein